MSAFIRTWLIVALITSANACLEPVVLGDGRALQDAAVDDAAEPDASEPSFDVPRFSEPVLIEPLDHEDNDADDDDPSLNRAMTQLFFNSTRDSGSGREDIWFSQREDALHAWGAPEPVTALNSDARETGTALSHDGLTIYWSSDREGGAGALDVYVSQRATLDGAWSQPEPLNVANGSGAESDPFLVGDGTQLLFTREGNVQLASRSGKDAPFGEALPLSTLNSEADDSDPWSDEDLSVVVFASDRSGSNRLYEARRE